jgi:lipopolysaccharide export LptBFGC system permease protein LptF
MDKIIGEEKYSCLTGRIIGYYVYCILLVILFAIISVIVLKYFIPNNPIWNLLGWVYLAINAVTIYTLPIALILAASGPIVDMLS